MPKKPESFGGWLKLEKPEHILGFLLKSLQHTMRQTFDETLRKQGVELSFAQFSALFNLHSDPGVTGALLARRAFVSAQTMSSALHALELEGYIERRPHPSSRRADSWSLTHGRAPRARARTRRRHGHLREDARRLRVEREGRVRGLSAPLHHCARRRFAGRAAARHRRSPKPRRRPSILPAPERRRQQHEERVDLEPAE